MTGNTYEDTLKNVNTHSRPSDLRITDMRLATIVGAPMRCPLIKISTNQGIEGYGEVRDGASARYALMLKSRILGENPCNIDKIFRRLKQFGSHARQGGGVCGIELALWDLAGKAYGVPVHAMLGGKFRDTVRVYCDTDLRGLRGRNTGTAMGGALKERMALGFTFLKMDVGIGLLREVPGALSGPQDFIKKLMPPREVWEQIRSADPETQWTLRRQFSETQNVMHPFTGIHVTEKGLEYLEQYVADVRAVIGYEVPLATDHFGHIGLEDCIKIARCLDKFNLAWYEDMLPWQMTDQYVRLANACTTPICTGEDIYLKENFKPLFESGGVSVIHPDLLTSGGIYENKKIGDTATPIAVPTRFDSYYKEPQRWPSRPRHRQPRSRSWYSPWPGSCTAWTFRGYRGSSRCPRSLACHAPPSSSRGSLTCGARSSPSSTFASVLGWPSKRTASTRASSTSRWATTSWASSSMPWKKSSTSPRTSSSPPLTW